MSINRGTSPGDYPLGNKQCSAKDKIFILEHISQKDANLQSTGMAPCNTRPYQSPIILSTALYDIEIGVYKDIILKTEKWIPWHHINFGYRMNKNLHITSMESPMILYMYM